MMIQEIVSSSKLPPLKRPTFMCDDSIVNHDVPPCQTSRLSWSLQGRQGQEKRVQLPPC
jgi:hypothetical protein